MLRLCAVAVGFTGAATIGIGLGLANNHPGDLRTVDSVTTGVSLALLLRQCEASPGAANPNFCTGYISATFDQLSLTQRICPPKGITTQQVYDVGRNYLFSHTMHQDTHPAWLLSEAFREAYDCAPK